MTYKNIKTMTRATIAIAIDVLAAELLESQTRKSFIIPTFYLLSAQRIKDRCGGRGQIAVASV
jgi:hypothetical protein